MRLRLNWLFLIFIYLSVNGQVFATAIHICSQMALSSTALSASQKPVNIHEHHQKSIHHEDATHNSMKHDESSSKSMENCQCIDCDCIQNIAGQTNSSLVQENSLIGYLPVLTRVSIVPIQNFISQPHTNPFRPPIIA
jgi:hypothetical protein